MNLKLFDKTISSIGFEVILVVSPVPLFWVGARLTLGVSQTEWILERHENIRTER
jgi:hypothetical protein